MRPYKAFYKNETTEVAADSSFRAQLAALDVFAKRFPRKKIRSHEITVMLLDVVHSTAEL